MIQNKIVGISGEQGSGKTTVLTYLGYIAYRNNMKIYSTYHVNYSGNKEINDYYPIGHLEDIKNMKGGPNGGVWLADELYQWLFSRSSQSEINKQISMVLMVARKRGISVLYTSHHPMHIDVMLRRVTNMWILPHMIPKRQLDNDKIEQIAEEKGMDPLIVKRYYRKQLKQRPEYWMIKCDKYNSLDRYIGTLNIKNLPAIFKMFDTTEEINPLDTQGKPEYIHEKGMELELHVERVATEGGFIVNRKEHSGKGSNSYADHTMYPKNNPKVMYYVDVCSIQDTRLIKTGLEMKSLLHESQRDNEHTSYAIIVFPYKDDLWYLDIKKGAYYLDYTSRVTIWERIMPFIHPFSELIRQYNDINSSGKIATVRDII